RLRLTMMSESENSILEEEPAGKRLVVAVVCILVLPLLFSAPQRAKQANSPEFFTVALPGRTTNGRSCECCNPMELRSDQNSRHVSHRNSRPSKQGTPLAKLKFHTAIYFSSSRCCRLRSAYVLDCGHNS